MTPSTLPVHSADRFGWRRSFKGWRVVLWAASLLVVLALLLPLLYLIVRAVEADSATWGILTRPRTYETLWQTTLLAATVTGASIAVALPLAWLTTRTDLPFRRMWAVLTPLPLVIPSYVGAYLIASAFSPRGLLQQLLEAPFGIQRLPDWYGLPGATFTLTLLSYPYVLVSVRAALLKMDPALEEAARSMGHSAWQTFWRVTFPLLRPALGAGGLLTALYTLRDFGAVALMRYDTFTRVIYVHYRSFDRSQAAAMSLILVVLTLGFIALEARLHGRGRYDRAGASRPPTAIPLGRWKWPALLFCTVVVVLGLALPAAVLVYWLVRGLSAGEALPGLGLAAWNSVLSSALGAMAAVLAALPIAILTVRFAGRFTRLLERLTYSVFALPGIVAALALVYFGVNLVPPLYQTLPMLLLAYVILFLPQAVSAVRTSLLQVHPQIEEAARGLGRRSWQVLLSITVPLIRPGLFAGASLVFLTAMKELPATLILAPIGFKTLATSVWSAVSEAYFAQAAAPALLILLLSSVPMAFLILHEQQTAD